MIPNSKEGALVHIASRGLLWRVIHGLPRRVVGTPLHSTSGPFLHTGVAAARFWDPWEDTHLKKSSALYCKKGHPHPITCTEKKRVGENCRRSAAAAKLKEGTCSSRHVFSQLGSQVCQPSTWKQVRLSGGRWTARRRRNRSQSWDTNKLCTRQKRQVRAKPLKIIIPHCYWYYIINIIPSLINRSISF